MTDQTQEDVNKLARATAATQAIKNTVVTSRGENYQSQDNTEIGIIKGLSPERLSAKIELRLKGYIFDNLLKRWILFRKPIMNDLGVGNFMTCLQSIDENVAFSYYNEKDIPRLVYHAFSQNYPTYIIYAKDFDLDPKDFNIIETVLFHYILSVYMAARHGGHRNAVRGTLSENVMAKLFEGGKEKPKGIKGWLNNFWGKDK